MANTAKLVFVFSALGVVLAGMVFALNGMFSEPTVSFTTNTTVNTTANATISLVKNVGIGSTNFLIPALILVAALVVISAVFMFKRNRR